MTSSSKLSRRAVSRRGILALAGAGVALGQAPAQPPAPSPDDRVAKARDDNRRGADTLAKFQLPMSTEPAFVFRA